MYASIPGIHIICKLELEVCMSITRIIGTNGGLCRWRAPIDKVREAVKAKHNDHSLSFVVGVVSREKCEARWGLDPYGKK